MTPPVESARLRAARAEAIKEAWRAGEAPDAGAALREHPELAADRAAAIDLAYEEFCAREEAGERLDSAAFCARFSFGASLRRLVNLHRFLDSHPDALAAAPREWPAPGDPVADFLVVRELGRGGFSRVFLALEASAGNRPVALKVAAAGSREADALGPLSHAHLTPVYSSRVVGAWNVVAMPFAGTATLEDALSAAWGGDPPGRPRTAAALLEAAARGGQQGDPDFPSRPPFPLHERMGYEEGLLAVAYRLLCALDYLHARGVAHRDLKPSNVLLAPTGHPYLLDFNLATHADDPWRLAGTLPYMAPEQLAMLADEQAAPPADWRPCDVFAFGVMLAELLAGKHPFGAGEAPAGAGQREVAAALLSAQRAGVPALPRHLPRAPREALGRCLRPDPAGRPTAAELVALFTPAAPRPRRRAALAALALVLPAALTAGWLLADRSDPAPSQVSLPTPEPPWPADPFERGAAYAGRGDFVSARIEFQKAAVAKKDGRAHACAAYCMARSGEHEAAVVELNLAIELGYRTAAVYANRAFSHSQRSRRDAALADCDAALRLDGHMRAARLTRAALLLQRQTRGGKLDPRAISDVRLGVSAGPNTANTWMTAAQIYALGSEGRPELRDAAAEAVAGAVRAGKSPAAIRENPVLRKALAGHPGFQAALLLPPGKADPALNPQLVNVVAEK